MADKTYIYALLCPDDGKARYVGQSRKPALRFRQHLSGALGTQERRYDAKDRWIQDLSDRGLEPVLAVLEEIEGIAVDYGPGSTRRRIQGIESRWINRLREKGHPLTNADRLTETEREAEHERMMAAAAERGRKLADALGVDPSELIGD